jgi:hypothetical protein
VEAGGIDALIDANRKKPTLKNRVEDATEAASQVRIVLRDRPKTINRRYFLIDFNYELSCTM